MPEPAWQRWVVLGVVGLGVALGPLDIAVNVAFPAITQHFAIELESLRWVIICYILAQSLLLGLGHLGDIVGHRRLFMLGVAVSAVSLTVISAAPSFAWFLVLRVFQGVGATLLLATAPALATLAFPETDRAKALGGFTMCIAAAAALGPLVGGVLIEQWGWGAVFWFRVPLAVVVFFAVWRWVPPTAGRPEQAFDFRGAAALSVALVCGLLGVTLATSASPILRIALVATGVLATVVFVRIERRVDEPVIDLALFGDLRFVVANAANVLSQLAAFTLLLLGPYFFVRYLDGDVRRAGVLLAIGPASVALASIVGGLLLGRASAWAVSVCALALLMAGLTGTAFWGVDPSASVLVGTLVLQGAGLGLFQVANMDFIMGSVAREQQGAAGALTMLTRTIGVVISASLGAMLFTAFGGSVAGGERLSEPFVEAYSAVFVAAGVVVFGALALMLSTRRGGKFA